MRATAVKLLVLGATGGTGQQIVNQALPAGHDVTVLARDGTKLTPRPHLRVLTGDALDANTLTEAMRGQDAIISALGRGYSFSSEHLIERAVPVILAAMRAAGVRRLLFTSAFGVGDSFGDAPFMARLFFSTLLRGIYADKRIGEQLISQSDLDWTIVRPSKMTDGPLTGNYRSGEGLVLTGMPSISRADVAHFELQAASNPQTIRKTLVVSN